MIFFLLKIEHFRLLRGTEDDDSLWPLRKPYLSTWCALSALSPDLAKNRR